MTTEHDQSRAVTATYDDATHARAAIVALERAGVEAGRIRLEDLAVRDRPTNAELRHTDMDTTRYMGSRIGIGAIVGFALGAVVGALVGAGVAVLGGFPAGWAALAGGVAGGAIIGPFLGGFFGGEMSLPVDNEDFATTFEAPDAPVRLHVVAADDAELDRVEHTLDGTGAAEVRRAS